MNRLSNLTVLYLWVLDFVTSVVFLHLSKHWVAWNLLLKLKKKKINTRGQTIKTRGSYKLRIMLSALEYSKPQQLKITHITSSWHHRSRTRINLGEQSSTTRLKEWPSRENPSSGPKDELSKNNLYGDAAHSTCKKPKCPSALVKPWLPIQVQR